MYTVHDVFVGSSDEQLVEAIDYASQTAAAKDIHNPYIGARVGAIGSRWTPEMYSRNRTYRVAAFDGDSGRDSRRGFST